jgi:hypothetical protein
LSIVDKSLGNEHPIHGFVMLFEALIEVEVERRGLPKDSREPAQISVNTHEMIKALKPYGGTVPALGEEAKKLPTLGQTTMLQPDRLLEFLENHLTTCASEDFWKQQPASSQYPFFGLSINIAHLRTLNARIASGGRIINEDLMTLENLLRDALGVRNTELAEMISRIDTKNEPKTVLNQMAGVVSHYYFGKRQLFDGGTNEYYEGRLINLNRNPEKILSALRTAGDAGELIGTLEQALSESIAGTDFKKPLIVQQFADTAKAMAEPEQPLIFHP